MGWGRGRGSNGGGWVAQDIVCELVWPSRKALGWSEGPWDRFGLAVRRQVGEQKALGTLCVSEPVWPSRKALGW